MSTLSLSSAAWMIRSSAWCPRSSVSHRGGAPIDGRPHARTERGRPGGTEPDGRASNGETTGSQPGSAPNGFGQATPNPGVIPGSGPAAANNVPEGEWNPLNPPHVKGDVEITVDSAGQVFLRGVVTSEEIAREIEQTARSVPGVSQVVSQLQVKPKPADVAGRDEPPPLPQPVAPGPGGNPLQVKPRRVEMPDQEAPPPLPQPHAPPPVGQPARNKVPEPPRPGVVPAHPAPAQNGVGALDGQRLTHRVVASLQRRPAVLDLPIKVRSTGDAVMLTGQVPSAYEDMIAYRSAQQTPGVRDVVDRLEFLVPDENHPNPLVVKGRPEDLELYLSAQMARHVGDLAHNDSVKAHGDQIEIRGTLQDAADRDRVLAILRSIPVLHGFRLDPTLNAD